MATRCEIAGKPTAPLAGPKPQTRPAATVEPLSPARYKVQFTASQELRDKLERLTALMRSEVPDGDLAAIIERAVSEKLQRLEARRFGKTKAPRKRLAETVTTPGSRHVPAALRRAVYERDESRCTFVDRQGRRCTERHRLEFHHDFPFGKGGDTGLVNLKLLCEQHNRYLAEVDYGKAAVQARVRQRLKRVRRRQLLRKALQGNWQVSPLLAAVEGSDGRPPPRAVMDCPSTKGTDPHRCASFRIRS
jgi:hypothetical protein